VCWPNPDNRKKFKIAAMAQEISCGDLNGDGVLTRMRLESFRTPASKEGIPEAEAAGKYPPRHLPTFRMAS